MIRIHYLFSYLLQSNTSICHFNDFINLSSNKSMNISQIIFKVLLVKHVLQANKNEIQSKFYLDVE
jgi:hypothetical protein